MTELTLEDRLRQTREVLDLLDDWNIPHSAQPELLGLPSSVRYRHFQGFRSDTPLPDEPDVQQRIQHLLGIAEALFTTYPMNPNMAPLWMRTGNRQFGGRKPMDILTEDGLAGLEQLRCHLDCAYEWEQDEKSPP